MNATKVQLSNDGQHLGFLGHRRYNWWFDTNFPHAFTIYDLDSFYDCDYFRDDHVDAENVQCYVDYVLDYGRSFLGYEPASILELGCGGGWFTEEFIRRGLDIVAVEGSLDGCQKTLSRGVPPAKLIRHDLRLPLTLNRSFDIVVCTEVAEHIEPPFSSQLINNIVNHSKLVWFSFEEPGTNEAHYHHCNEQPEKFWRNLFAFFNYKMASLPQEAQAKVGFRGRCIFYHQDLQLPPTLGRQDERAEQTLFALGTPHRILGYKLINLIKKFVPPIVLDAYRIMQGRRR